MSRTLRNMIILMVCFLMVIPLFYLKAEAANLNTPEEAINWVKSKNGTTVGAGQCVSLVAEYIRQLGGTPPSCNFAIEYSTCAVPAGFTRIPKANGSPQKGDILIWTGNGGKGHVAIYESDYSTWHQNAENKMYVQQLTYYYTLADYDSSLEYWGVMRPNNFQYDTEPPAISDYQVSNISHRGYNVSCTFSDNIGVTSVFFPTWTENNGQDDIIWHQGTINGNTATVWIPTSEHNSETGCIYYTDIYVYDAAGYHAFANTVATIPYFCEELVDPVVYNSDFYRNTYPDLAAAFGNDDTALLDHWISTGIREKRMASPVFNIGHYLDANPSVKNAFGDDYVAAIKHFVHTGASEGLSSSNEFVLSDYKANYYDLQEAFGTDNYKYYKHYVEAGRSEGRIANRRTSVTLNPCGGVVSPSEVNVTTFTYYGTLPEPTKQYYIFDGWYTKETGGEKIENSSVADYSTVQTLYAHWSEPISIIVIPPVNPYMTGHIFTKDEMCVEVAYDNGMVIETTDYSLAQSGGENDIQTLTFAYGPLTESVEVELIPEPSFILPANLTVIEEEAFMGIDAEVVLVPESCISIGPRAFEDCPNLKYVIVSDLDVIDVAADALEGTNAMFVELKRME